MIRIIALMTGLFQPALAQPIVDPNWIAFYHVPVSDPQLAAYSNYFISPGGALDPAEYSATSSRVEFSLPLWLVGVDRHFVMNRLSDGSWSEPGVTGVCRFDADQVACDVQFARFPIDETKVADLVRAQNQDPADVAGRLAVANAFYGELHGTITIRLTRPAGP